MAPTKPRSKLKKWLFIVPCLLVAAVGIYFLLPSLASPSQTAVIYSPQPDRNFATTAQQDGQFTNDQYNFLTTNLNTVIIEKQHDDGNINTVYAATRELKQRNPKLKVYTYFNTKIWIDKQSTAWQEPGYDPGFNQAWLIRDNKGNLIEQGDKTGHYFLDLTNPDYRNWALAQLQHRLKMAPFDGILFDSGSDLVDGYNGKQWTRLLGSDRVATYNAGMKDLMVRAKAQFAGKDITFNGLTNDKNVANPDRSLNKLDYTDGATDETFCLDFLSQLNTQAQIEADIQLMQTYSNKKIMLHTNFDSSKNTVGDPAAIGRFCQAAFMMGWQPGSSYHSYAAALQPKINAYLIQALQFNLPELSLNIGNPTGQAENSNGLYQRGFTNGRIYANLSSSPQTFKLPAKLMQFEAGKQLATYNANDTFTLGAQSGAYFINDSFVSQSGAAAPTVTAGGASSHGGGSNKGSAQAASTKPKGLSKVVAALSDDIAPIIPKKAQKWVLLGIVLAALTAALAFGIPWVRRGGHKKFWSKLSKKLRKEPLSPLLAAEHVATTPFDDRLLRAHMDPPHVPGAVVHPNDHER